MKIDKVYNDFIIVEDVVVEYPKEGGLVVKSPTLKQVMEEVATAKQNNREHKLFLPDVVFKIVVANPGVDLKEGDLIHCDSTGMKLGDYRVIRAYNIICKE